jgi:exodeoxyribonuclease-3
MLSLLTVNIGAASRTRAEAMLRWLDARTDDVVVLTETSAGDGTAHLLDQFRRAGYRVIQNGHDDGERGTAIVSRVRVLDTHTPLLANVTIPGRVAAAVLDVDPPITVIGVYVPSRDRTLDKVDKKQRFIASLLDAIALAPSDQLSTTIVAGDYNVIARSHRPLHAGFLPFEFGLLESLSQLGMVDAHQRCAPDAQPYSWIGRTGDGYCYDYIHVGRALVSAIGTCTYLHETRDQRLTDHAAVALALQVSRAERLQTLELADEEPAALF